MDKLFSEFPTPSYADWVNQLVKDLKGKTQDLLQTDDPIEGFSFSAYQHQDSEDTQLPYAFNITHIRNTHRKDNSWENMATIYVKDERTANKRALQLLNIGITSLRFELKKNELNWKLLLNDIQLKYIQITFKISKYHLYFSLLEEFPKDELENVFFELDWIDVKDNQWSQITKSLNKQTRYIFCANGYSIQQCGCNTSQEVAYCIASAHEFLVQLIQAGLSADKATQCIHFNVGTSTNYFYEIAKIRALRLLWARIVQEYQPSNIESLNARITGITGFTNKSLKDPYTNLLRQTTEAMSLIVAGVHAVCVQPYDCYSTVGETKLSIRMAANIPLILQEESYFDKVIDPLGGSYAIEHLTYKIADIAWKEFQQIEKLGGIQNIQARNQLTEKINEIAQIRTKRINDKTDILIGINEFPNPTKENNHWLSFEKYLNMDTLILEQKIDADK